MVQDYNNQDLEFIFSTVSAVDFLQMHFAIQLLSELGRLKWHVGQYFFKVYLC